MRRKKGRKPALKQEQEKLNPELVRRQNQTQIERQKLVETER